MWFPARDDFTNTKQRNVKNFITIRKHDWNISYMPVPERLLWSANHALVTTYLHAVTASTFISPRYNSKNCADQPDMQERVWCVYTFKAVFWWRQRARVLLHRDPKSMNSWDKKKLLMFRVSTSQRTFCSLTTLRNHFYSNTVSKYKTIRS